MIIKTITLTRELDDKLKGEANGSALIRSLLEKHYQEVDDPYARMTPQELEFEIKKAEILKEAQDRINAIENGANKRESPHKATPAKE